jgi:hypothetical protein
MPDIRIIGGGAVYFLQPLNDNADKWLDDNMPPSAFTSTQGYAIPAYQINKLLGGFIEAGFVINDARDLN